MTFDPAQIADKAVEAAMALVIWIGKRHMDKDAEVQKELFLRLHTLETERVKPDELVRVESRLQEVADLMASNHAEVLQTIISQAQR